MMEVEWGLTMGEVPVVGVASEAALKISSGIGVVPPFSCSNRSSVNVGEESGSWELSLNTVGGTSPQVA